MTVTVRDLLKRLEALPPKSEITLDGHCCGGTSYLHAGDQPIVLQGGMDNNARLASEESTGAVG